MRFSSVTSCAGEEPGATSVLDIRGRFLTAAVLPVEGDADPAFYAAVDAALRRSPHFFANAPLVIDLEHSEGLESEAALRTLLGELRARDLFPFAVQGASGRQREAGLAVGLVSLNESRTASNDTSPQPEQQAESEEDEERPSPSRVITQPVRSGQRIVADQGDLIVVGSVSSGAELIARGSVHVYGTLRGRVMAGAFGDRTARIFCQNLQAELIAIGGLYRTSDGFDGALARQRVQAFLRDDSLCIETLT